MRTAEEITRGYWKAEESRDLDRIMEFFAPGAEWRGPGTDLRGEEQIRNLYAESVAAYPELEVDVRRALGTGDEAALEYSAVFRDAAGNERRLSGINMIRADGERIVSLTTHYDPAQIAPPSGRFADRRVLVTGCGGGIGAAVARQFLGEGAWVTGAEVNGELLESFTAGLDELGERFAPIAADITEATRQAEMIASACGPEGELDVLVNNAAVFLLGGVEATEEQWRRTFEVNLMAPAQLVAQAADALGRSSAAAVVNLASVSGYVAEPERWTYNACKGAMHSLTRCQAMDLASRRVRVNSVSPGFTWTEVLDRAAGGDRAKWDPIWGAFSLEQRCAEPAEVARAIAFLASEEASYVNGADLKVDGGMLTMGPEGSTVYDFGS